MSAALTNCQIEVDVTTGTVRTSGRRAYFIRSDVRARVCVTVLAVFAGDVRAAAKTDRRHRGREGFGTRLLPRVVRYRYRGESKARVCTRRKPSDRPENVRTGGRRNGHFERAG